MSMLNTHSLMPATASATGTGTAVSVSTQASGVAAVALLALGIALLVLTCVFAIAAIRGLLPRRSGPGEAAPSNEAVPSNELQRARRHAGLHS
jgi:hypothetical protein